VIKELRQLDAQGRESGKKEERKFIVFFSLEMHLKLEEKVYFTPNL
jgi:hypothetical protein